jgi:hypothetical protein
VERLARVMSDKQKERAERRERHVREIEASQKALRESISETERLAGESETMLRHHHQEREDDGE